MKKNKKRLLARYKGYKLECNGINHYFTGKTIRNINVEKCWCKK